jgi:glycosyltransferase involved in cell wall biosynthesis
MGNQICLDKRYSTTRRLFKGNYKSVVLPPLPVDRCLFGGLRLQGYIKTNHIQTPLITVITVVLNDEEGLMKTIASVIEQTYDNIEFIIIDGGSSDSSLKVIRDNNHRIDLWISEPDEGIFFAMNKGIDFATGQWINFMNAGDYFYEKDTVQRVFEKRFNEADFIYGHTCFLGGDFNGIVKAWDFKILWKTMVFTHQSLFTKREVLKNYKFQTKFKICADYDLIYNSYIKGLKFYNSDTVIAAFNPGFSDVSRAKMAVEKWKVVRKHRNDLKFHWFYFQLLIKRFFRDLNQKLRSKNRDW